MLMVKDADFGIKRTATLPLAIMDKLLVVFGEDDTVPIPANLTPITQVNMVDYFTYLFLLVVFMKFFKTKKQLILGVFVFSSGHRAQITCSL